jgi:UDPglucose--hexose-1-phosphate uridylyltransferase
MEVAEDSRQPKGRMSSARPELDLSRFSDQPHRRMNPLTGEWVLVSPQRAGRPWQGQVERPQRPAAVAYDPHCYLCPGNERAGGVRNPEYSKTFVFGNDFAALRPTESAVEVDAGGLLVARTESGVCRVVCFSPRHDLTLARMAVTDIRGVVDTWVEQFTDLGAQRDIRYVQIFENRGEIMGCSNPHPHGQIWANATVPNEPAKEQAALLGYSSAHGSCMLCDYMTLERNAGERLIYENDGFFVVVPFWAVWPFEVLLLSKRHARDLTELSEQEREQLADVLKKIATRYDNLFQISFPYSMGFHQRPTDGVEHDEWHLHAHFYPPLLRSATVKKFMVGYEMLAMPQRDITPESAAERLRGLSEKHYLDEP